MAPTGRSIRLFLTDGSPHGLVIAEIGNWSGKAVAAPRTRLTELLARPEASRTGVYVLAGPDPDRNGGLLAYIGEADDVAARLRHHLRSETKDFFDRVAIVVSSSDTLTKAHVRYIESQLIRMIRAAGSVMLTNDTLPDFQRLPEADRADMDYFVAQLRIVLPILGLDLLRQAPRIAASGGSSSLAEGGGPTFGFAPGGASATARETDQGFVVLAGSTARRTATGTFPVGYQALRAQLVAEQRLVEGSAADLYCFAADIAFSSPSAAASIVAARSASGPLEWKITDTGETYRDWRARTLAAA